MLIQSFAACIGSGGGVAQAQAGLSWACVVRQVSQAHHPGLPQAARYPPNRYPEVEVFPHLACMFTALCGLSRSSRRLVVSLSSWSEGREGSRGWIRATVFVNGCG